MRALKTSILALMLVLLGSISGSAQRTASEERGRGDRGGGFSSSAGSGVASRGISGGDYSAASTVTGRTRGAPCCPRCCLRLYWYVSDIALRRPIRVTK